jgi:diacylglycerol O-acyltransferase
MAARESMASADAAWLNIDRPKNTADVVVVLTFSEPLGHAALRRVVERRLLTHDRFRQRPVANGVLGGATWETDPRFSLERHLLRHRLSGRGRDALKALVGQIATEPLDPLHPLWRFHLVEGWNGGSAVVAKLHHCIADGFALVALLLSMADEPPDGAGPVRKPPAARELSIWERPAEALPFATSLARMAALWPDPPTALARPLSGRRRVAWSRGLSLERVKRAARARGVTVNDVLMASLAGALRSYLASTGTAVDRTRLRALVPVNLRPPGEPDGVLGNRFGLVFLDLPVNLRSAPARVEAIRARMNELKRSPDAVVSFAVLAAMGYSPRVVEHALASFFASKASLVVTNVQGPREPLRLAGKRIDQLMFWVPHPVNLGLGVSILSYAGQVRVGVRADEAVVPDPARLLSAFQSAVAELRAP